MKTKVEILEKYLASVNTPINNKAPLDTQLQLVTQATLLAMQEYAELYASQFKASQGTLLQSRIKELESENEELRKKGQWISVKERLPKIWDEYMVCFESGSRAICTFFLPAKQWIWEDDGIVDESTSPIIAWQPLPSKPENYSTID